MSEVRCRCCGEARPALERSLVPGRYGEAVLASTGVVCWQAWVAEQTIVTSHLGLQPHVPHDRQHLYRHMSAFLKLPVAPSEL